MEMNCFCTPEKHWDNLQIAVAVCVEKHTLHARNCSACYQAQNKLQEPRRLVSENLDALCEFPVLLSSSTLVFNVCLRFSGHLQTKASKTSQCSLKTRNCHHSCLGWRNLERFSYPQTLGCSRIKNPDIYRSGHWIVHFFSFLPLTKGMPACNSHITT